MIYTCSVFSKSDLLESPSSTKRIPVPGDVLLILKVKSSWRAPHCRHTVPPSLANTTLSLGTPHTSPPTAPPPPAELEHRLQPFRVGVAGAGVGNSVVEIVGLEESVGEEGGGEAGPRRRRPFRPRATVSLQEVTSQEHEPSAVPAPCGDRGRGGGVRSRKPFVVRDPGAGRGRRRAAARRGANPRRQRARRGGGRLRAPGIPPAVCGAAPGSVEDVAKMVRFAREQGLHLAGMGAVGDSRSTLGQAQVAAGVVIDMATLRSIGPVGPDGVWVEAGASWLEVLEATLPSGLSPPTLTDYLGLRVGGTLSVGGIGGQAFRHWLQGGVTPPGVVACRAVEGRSRRSIRGRGRSARSSRVGCLPHGSRSG